LYKVDYSTAKKDAALVCLLASLACVGYTRQNDLPGGRMTDEITPELFDHLVELAALELSKEEGEYLRKQLNNQLMAIHELESIPLDPSTPIASHGVPYTSATSPLIRDDVILSTSDPARLLQGAPEVEDNYFVVPEIPHQDLN